MPRPMLWSFIVNQWGEIIQVNPQLEKMFGYIKDELLGKAVETLVPERFRKVHPDHRAGYFAHPRVREMGAGQELFALRKDGSEFPVEISLNHVQVENETFALSALRDITERKRAEKLLRLNDERIGLVISRTGQGIWDWDILSDETYLNPMYYELTGYKEGEIFPTSPNANRRKKN
jgi:two-component system, LuxR family, sensor kinase FixL